MDCLKVDRSFVGNMNEAEQQTPGLGQTQFLAMRESRIVKTVLAQILEFPPDVTSDS